ncbi:MAG: DUF1801 domain-containing protein [Anaerolineales bacterium]|nr:MAG: DUF1801 domain-containing protein [Anaerolineales bacterium]
MAEFGLTPSLRKFLERFPEPLQVIATELRTQVLDLAPDVIEQIDESAQLLGYGYAETYTHLVCVIIFQQDYINLGFPRGVDLEDPEALLEGTGKRARHVKIYSVEDVTLPGVLSLLREAIEITPRPGDED